MGNDYLLNPVGFLVEALLGLFALLLLLRFLLQLCRADFYNPVSQLILKLTQPVLQPLRRLVPGGSRFDGASLAALVLLQLVTLVLLAALRGVSIGPVGLLLLTVAELLSLTINVFFVSIVVQALLSWLSPGRSPLSTVLYSLNEPLLGPARRLLPPLSGVDLSPILVLLGLQVGKMLLLPPLLAAAKAFG